MEGDGYGKAREIRREERKGMQGREMGKGGRYERVGRKIGVSRRRGGNGDREKRGE